MTEQHQKIVALVDGSIYSASLCEHAAWVARRTGAPVELIHVLGRREAPGRQDLSGAIALGARTALLEELATLDAQRARLASERGRAILEDARAMLEQAGVTQVTTRLRHGDMIETVAEVEAEARVLMIGKRGESADFAKGHLGSNLERVVRASHRPVLVAARAFRPIQRVLLAFDGGASAQRAVEHVARSPLFQGLPVRLVMVGEPAPQTQAALARAQTVLTGAGIAADTAVQQGQPEQVLGQMVEETPFDLLVMGAYGHSRIRSLIIGSTTTAMIRSCKVPVVLIR
ncbi:universal stress protein [Paracoccus sp. SMMA_5_TC]|nr:MULTISPECIES: universal stress protein [unclassified Paracoccus (in: a-proteobacteria)]UXU76211.1 universal stress protein [Paracoccus sp. SMMA_5]UXU82110.1 universal stress protein [Paracoccus sp. SMMA_5_TC]